jgi:general secretion pathway protein C
LFNQANRLVEPAKILIIVGIAYTLATSGWYLVSGPTPAPLEAPSTTTGPSATKAAMSVADIVSRNLFGVASAVNGAEPAVFDAPETRLRLTLEGIFLAENPQESAAIVAEPGRPGELVVVGGKLPGSAVLTEVHADRIVLRRGSVFETLRFPDEPTLISAQDAAGAMMPEGSADVPDYAAEQQPQDYVEPQYEGGPPSADAGTAADTASLAGIVQSYRERLQQDPNGTLNALGMAPVAVDGAQGYRLDNLANSPYLAQTGLQAGDVVLSVNGRPVGDVQQDHLEIDNILAQGSARLEVQRGTRRFFVTASLK